MDATTMRKYVERVYKQYGQPSAAWCNDFPALLMRIATDWELELGAIYPDSTHFVCAAMHLPSHDRVVLKIGYPAAEFQQELSCYMHVETAQRYPIRRIDYGQSAILLDMLLPGSRLDADCTDPMQQIEFIVPLLYALPITAVQFPHIPTLASIAADVFPHAARVQAHGESLIAPEHLERAQHIISQAADTDWCLLHGDIHPGNVLLSGSGYRLIDPLGIIAPPAVECSVLLRYHYLGGHGSRAERTRRTAAVIEQFATMSSFAVSDIARWNYCMMVIAAWWSFQSRGVISERELAAIDDFAAIASDYAPT